MNSFDGKWTAAAPKSRMGCRPLSLLPSLEIWGEGSGGNLTHSAKIHKRIAKHFLWGVQPSPLTNSEFKLKTTTVQNKVFKRVYKGGETCAASLTIAATGSWYILGIFWNTNFAVPKNTSNERNFSSIKYMFVAIKIIFVFKKLRKHHSDFKCLNKIKSCRKVWNKIRYVLNYMEYS